MNPVHYLSEPAKAAGDALSVGATVAALFSWLPQVSALLAVVWFAMRLYETWLSIKIKERELDK